MNSHNSLRMANGESLCPVGETVLNISFRDDPNWKFSHSVMIAEIEVPVILGNDFMTENNFHLKLGEYTIEIGDHVIHCVSKRILNHCVQNSRRQECDYTSFIRNHN